MSNKVFIGSIEKFIYLCVESEYKRTWKENKCVLWCDI